MKWLKEYSGWVAEGGLREYKYAGFCCEEEIILIFTLCDSSENSNSSEAHFKSVEIIKAIQYVNGQPGRDEVLSSKEWSVLYKKNTCPRG